MYKVLYCVQQPHLIALCPLEEVGVGIDGMVGQDGRCGQVQRYRCNFAKFCTAEDMIFPAGAKLWFWPRLHYEGGVIVSSDMMGLPVAPFTDVSAMADAMPTMDIDADEEKAQDAECVAKPDGN